jgi:DNA helicase II / ATP-dependent DNA helicase PcrA
LQKRYYNKMKFRLQRLTHVVVQQYISGERSEHPSSELVFDRSGTVTILCDQSAKGLEFDAVFIPEIQARQTTAADKELFRMKMYVLSSRARRHLTYGLTVEERGIIPPVLEMFPNRQDGRLEWMFND